MVKRKVIVEIGDRGAKTDTENSCMEDDIREWLENGERDIPYFGNYKDKLTVIYEEDVEQ